MRLYRFDWNIDAGCSISSASIGEYHCGRRHVVTVDRFNTGRAWRVTLRRIFAIDETFVVGKNAATNFRKSFITAKCKRSMNRRSLYSAL